MRREALWLMCLAAAWPVFAQDAPLRPMPRPEIAQNITLPAAPASALPRPSLVPLPRPSIAAAALPSLPPEMVPAPTASAPSAQMLRPQPRPSRPSAAATNVAPIAAAGSVSGSITRSPRPEPRPKALTEAVAAVTASPVAPSAPNDRGAPSRPNLIQLLFGTGGGGAKVPKDPSDRRLASAPPAPQSGAQNAPRKGSVCGDRAIRGEEIKSITSKVKGCGVAKPVRVTEVAGIKLTQAVTVECDTVIALRNWIDTAMRPAFDNREVAQLRIAAHYACRGRNNQRGARISEHGKGRALDISGFIFVDGSEWTIARDYNKQIRAAHKGACGIFGTTLGPGSDGFHEDHLHFDVARYRSGPYCR